MQRHRTPQARLAHAARRGAICLAFVCAAGGVRAQEILPNDFVPAPAGTNVALAYYLYGHNTSFSVAGGPTYRANTGLETHLGIARFVHYDKLGDFPVGVQVFQVFGSLSGGRVGGQNLGSSFGVTNLALSAFIWPYSNDRSKTHFGVFGYIYPPTGTYDRDKAINIGDNRWRGTVQVGLNQGFGERVSVDAGLDVTLYGDNTRPVVGRRFSQSPSYRFQTFVNYNWTKTFVTSIGYQAILGGDQKLDGVFNGNRTELQRVRAAASLFWTPTFQTVLEVDRDIQVVGGFKQAIGAQLRLLYVF